MGKVKLPGSLKSDKNRRISTQQSIKKESPVRSAKRGSQSRSKDRKTRSRSRKKDRRTQQQDLRKQIAIKEAQLAKMTAAAQKLR